MRNTESKKQNKGSFVGLLDEPTQAKASGLAFTLAAIAPVLLTVLFVIVVGALGLMKEGVEQKDWYLYSSVLLPQIAFVIVAMLYFKWTKSSFKMAIKEQKCKPKYFLLAIILQFGLMSLSELNTLFLKLLGNIGYQDVGISLPSMNGVGFIGVLIAVAILPAILEEVIFRGLLLKGLHGFGTALSVVICGGLFALYHQNPAQTLYQFCCGMAFALVAIKSGSILPTVLSHFLNNAAILVLTKLGIISFSPTVQFALIIGCSLCLIGSLIYLIFIDKQGACTSRNEKIDKKEVKNFWLYAAVGIVVCAISWLTMLLTGIVG